MYIRVEKKPMEEIRSSNILPQTTFWGRIKNQHGFKTLGFEIIISKDILSNSGDQLHVHDDLLVLLRRVDKEHCFAYIPYGPKLEPVVENQGLFLEALSEELKKFLPSKCIFIRYDLRWENQWAKDEDYFDESGNWLGPPQQVIQELRVNYKTIKNNLKKSPEDILPKNTFFLDLKQDEENLLLNMRYNTRYNIRRAINMDIHVKEYSIDFIGDWYKLYKETAHRHNMPLQDEFYFASILKNQDNNKKGVTVKMLMAENQCEFLASMFLVLSNKRGTYLYGASTSKRRNALASYALQWESIKISKALGCTEYDMFGSAPNLNRSHPLHGVHIYKKGFGGNLYHRMGCWDYPFLNNEYECYRLQEINHQEDSSIKH